MPMKLKVLFAAGVAFVFLYLVGLVNPSPPLTAAEQATQEQAERQAKTPPEQYDTTLTAEQSANPGMPQSEKAFLVAVETGRGTYAAGKNEMAKGAARPIRARAICSFFGPRIPIDDWIGTVSALSSNGDGKGVLAIEIGRDVFVKTWNNAVSDIVDETLLEPGSSIYTQALSLAKRQRVRFSGMFLDSPTDCVKESSLTLHGSLTEPEFIFRFSGVASLQ
jgi:hypothetical protein